MKTSFEIRSLFLEYFRSKGHTVVESSSLTPQNDPTLLFTNAGMVQFKGVFLGEETRPYKTAVSSQKCMRAGGKHNDLENVGRTARHHTFFEMLGNFSFGNYFKAEAIAMAWEFITGILKIAPDRLWVTVFEEDDEALDIWENSTGMSPDRIVRMGEKDNFWSMGDTGPCGPCSEILIDQGEGFSCGSPECKVGCDCDRYLELWNLVFMQFNRDECGCKTPLPRPSIDTGMGLERTTAIVQNANSNYDTDLFIPLIGFVEKISNKTYRRDPGHDVSMRIIADHSRAIAFLVADGVLPSNEGRGYVLRRIMRRAARHGRLLDIKKSFLFESVDIIADQMQGVYPDIQRSKDYITKVVMNEEETFAVTLESGLKILEDEIENLKQKNAAVIPGETAFKLYDTHGFPLDLTADIASEHGMNVDQDGFKKSMQQQRIRARQAWKGSGDEKVGTLYNKLLREGIQVAFNGYDKNDIPSKVLKIFRNGQTTDAASQGEEVEIVAAETSFYGESGGQTGDKGMISGKDFSVEITDTLRPLPEIIVHRGMVKKGQVKVGDKARFQVDEHKRRSTENNHTATHILQAVLREYLGKHVKQAGSLVTPERLRFDFTHFEAIKNEDLIMIEERVNDRIRENAPLDIRVLPLKEARDMGATALFGEKYGDRVRVVGISDYSMELCGGTHTRSTGEIGIFKFAGEGAVAAGVRRIEAVTGREACLFIRKEEDILASLANLLKTEPVGLIDKVKRVIATQKGMEKELEKLKSRFLAKKSDSILDKVKVVSGIKVLAAEVDEKDPKELRSYGDKIKDRLGSGIIIFGAVDGEKAQLLSMVTKDITDRFSARGIIEKIAPVIGGRGGGKRDMAQAGGRSPEKVGEALEKALDIIEKMSTGG